jgi:carbon-monoxide dehydrogenase small subunit
MATALTRHSDAQTIAVSFTLNGRLQEIDVEPHELLLDVVRDRLGLTGAKRSCDVEVCGACTLLVDGRPVSACTTLAFEVRGCSVLTIEGLADNGKLHPLQQAFIALGGESAAGRKSQSKRSGTQTLHARQSLPLYWL